MTDVLTHGAGDQEVRSPRLYITEVVVLIPHDARHLMPVA